MFCSVRDEALSDVLKVWLYAVASILLGVWISPFLYNAGKALAEVSAVKVTNEPLVLLANLCRTASFPQFFVASMVLSGVVLFVPFIEWLHGGRTHDGSPKKPWSLRLPNGAKTLNRGQSLARNDQALHHLLQGFFVVVGLFFLLGGILTATGIFQWHRPVGDLSVLLIRALAFALGLAALQEFLFRGIALGIFLRAMRPAAALGMSALLFGMVHFLTPPSGINVPDPDASGIGFEMCRMLVAQVADPRMFLGVFVPLLALGAVLAFARWRTASLWLPIGLHTGWLFVNSVMSAMTMTTDHSSSLMWVISGTALRQGLVPLGGILAAGWIIDYLTITDTDAAKPTT